MPKLPRWTAIEAQRALETAGFQLLRSNHRIYARGTRRVVVPFHAGVTLHPKVVKQVLDAIEETQTG
jgi:predicted RNA binding protein YcfA (HicA-like mRNA interferase family)